ncbi:hypothetical protein CYMTET_18402 [Cymbomonas tetramitiformis]|uniref:GINS subunit domain-containing protein n=1 Tax=Cymbomonas tetramitiformis TaxID=36881 RepID=A0AAE0G849_9CHLO|nr:hypothetical protein CYMTET_18402 [Cymbomonas tetramitiformis]
MAVFGKTAVQLVQEVANMDGEGLPSFKEDVVKKVLDEVDEHHKALLNILSTVQDAGLEWNQMEANDANALMVHHESLLRNKRLLLGYVNARMNRIKKTRWHKGRALQPELKERMAPTEQQFFREYDKLLMEYQDPRTGVGIDLTLDMTPPKDHKIEVRVMARTGFPVILMMAQRLAVAMFG